MKYELFIARRYLTAKRKQAFISVITLISILGITIGVMALIIAIALITGFQSDVQDKILGATSHVMVYGVPREGMKDYKQLMAQIEKIKEVRLVSPVVYDTVLISGPYKTSGVMLRGLDFDLEKKSAKWLSKLESGNLPSCKAEREEILLGHDLAFTIGAGLGDVVTVLTPSSRLSPIGPIPTRKRFVVAGVFRSGLYEFDSSTVLLSLGSAQRLFHLEDDVTLLQVKIEDIFSAPEIAVEIKKTLPAGIFVTTWMEMNKPLFSALKLEKKLLFLTITLIVVVAALNIIATLILMVMEKTRDIGVLIAMGASSRSIRQIFFFQGTLIAIIGTLVGTILGLGWCWLANTFELIKVPVDIYQISYVPFYIRVPDLVIIIGVTFLICFLSTIFPSHRASKVDPVIALKYE